METGGNKFSEVVPAVLTRLSDWWGAVDRADLVLAAVMLAAVILLRRPLARGILSAIAALLATFSVDLSDEIRSELEATTRVLLVTLALFFALQTVQPPEVAGGVLERIIISAAIIAIFAGWYNLCGPFVSLLCTEQFNKLSVEADWMERVARFAVVLLGLTSLLKVWQVDITGALTGVGVLGAGLAIAAQDLIRNFIGGMNNVSERRFKVGDAIQVDGRFLGTVKTVDLRSTQILGFDQIPRFVPNSDLSNAVVLNYTHMAHRRILLTIPLVLNATRQQVEDVLEKLKTYHRESGDFSQLQDAPKYICVEQLGKDSIDLMFYAWTNSGAYDDFRDVQERLSLKILDVVKEAGTSLAYPTRKIINSDDA